MAEQTTNKQFRYKKKQRARNALPLEDRMAVIRAYAHIPVYETLAYKFNCSSKQIRNIITKRKQIEEEYASLNQNDIKNQKHSAEQRLRENLQFLDEVIIEFIQRTAYHRIQLNAEKLLTMAAQVTKAVAITNFRPSEQWLEDFLQRHNIDSLDVKHLNTFFNFTHPKKAEFRCIDVINYIIRMQAKSNQTHYQSAAEQTRQKKFTFLDKVLLEFLQRAAYHKLSLNAAKVLEMATQVSASIDIANFKPNNVWLEDFMLRRHLHSFTQFDFAQPKECKFDCIDLIKYVIEQEQAKQQEQQCKQNQDHENVGNMIRLEIDGAAIVQHEPEQSVPEIADEAQALQHIKALQDYALLHDNYRAIGLLTQLEDAIINPPKMQDFLADDDGEKF